MRRRQLRRLLQQLLPAAGEGYSGISPSRTCAGIGLDHAQVSYTPFGFASILRVASGPEESKNVYDRINIVAYFL